ncbi:MAG: 23S rRNA (guanosine(2251)-2'-O)-methyltransferase RlmB [Clostridia bacterium]|nr:23S rRNA (guanosine(2251)-2'-O)-methyltransferase RlmB [Clostridia bacterium]
MENNAIKSDIIFGRNAVTEALRSGRTVDRLMITKTAASNAGGIIAKCKAAGIPIKEVPAAKLDAITGNAVHQGLVLTVAATQYSSVDAILQAARDAGEAPFIIICDGIEDPHNLGAIIRTAETCRVHGVIIPERRSASLNATVAKTSSGALEYVKVARVTNLVNEIEKLKEQGVWVFGADMDGEDISKVDFTGPLALVIGNEGSGIGRLVAKSCDKIVSIPMYGKINSLNASVAAGIMMFEAAKQRNL